MKKDLAVQLHHDFNRTGCYHCPKQPKDSLITVCQKYPEQWKHIREMDKQVPNEFSPNFSLDDIEQMAFPKAVMDEFHDQMFVNPDNKKEIDLKQIIDNAKESCCDKCDMVF